MQRPAADIQDGRVLAVLDRHLPAIIARSILDRARREAAAGPGVSWTDPDALLDRLAVGVRLFAAPERVAAILRDLTNLAVDSQEAPKTPTPSQADSQRLRPAVGPMTPAGAGTYPQPRGPGDASEMTVTLTSERDLPRARQVARELCEKLGARGLRQQLLITIVSELGRNMVQYAGGGRITLRLPNGSARRVGVLAIDQGPGITNLADVMAGKHKSRTGLGRGIASIMRVADSFQIDTGSTGTTVSVELTV